MEQEQKTQREIMTPETFTRKRRAILELYSDDYEYIHYDHDALMIEVLRTLGYGEGLDIIEEQTRWYA